MSSTKPAPANEPVEAASDPFRVLVVDDSAVIRGMLSRILETDSEIRVVASVGNGEMAITAAKRHSPDVVVLDIEMPVMDGITALPKIIEADPGVKVIMASTLTLRNADISLKAMSLGAADYIPKPTSTSEISSGYDFKRDLIAKVKTLAAVRRAADKALSAMVMAAPSPFHQRHAPLRRALDVERDREGTRIERVLPQ